MRENNSGSMEKSSAAFSISVASILPAVADAGGAGGAGGVGAAGTAASGATAFGGFIGGNGAIGAIGGGGGSGGIIAASGGMTSPAMARGFAGGQARLVDSEPLWVAVLFSF